MWTAAGNKGMCRKILLFFSGCCSDKSHSTLLSRGGKSELDFLKDCEIVAVFQLCRYESKTSGCLAAFLFLSERETDHKTRQPVLGCVWETSLSIPLEEDLGIFLLRPLGCWPYQSCNLSYILLCALWLPLFFLFEIPFLATAPLNAPFLMF